jgi:hypothetical protein
MLLSGIRFKQDGRALLFVCRKMKQHNKKAEWFILLSIFVLLSFLCIFTELRSKDMFGVDGAFRCLEVYRRKILFFHENNHLLYPANVLIWSRISKTVGREPSTPEGFFAMAQLMNCVAGAGCLAILFYLTYRASSSGWLALGVAASYGFSRAFLIHSTNSAEALMGVFWSLLALSCASLAVKYASSWPLIGSGLLFSLAMATYQTTIFLAPAAIALFWYGRSKAADEAFRWRSRAYDLAIFVWAGLVGCVLIFGLAYRYEGIHGPVNMLTNFFVHRDARAYLGVGVGKSINLPVGMVRNVFPILSNFAGIRTFLSGPKLTVVFSLLLIISSAALLMICAIRLRKGWTGLQPRTQTGVLVAVTGLTFTIVPLIIWDPQYDKLWLQPLACLAFLVGIALGAVHLPGDKRILLSKVIPGIVFAGLAFNVVEAVRNHLLENNDVKETERLATIIGERDLLIGDWDKVSVLYDYGWSRDGHFLSFPSEAVFFGPDSVSRLRKAVEKTQASGGRIYFLGILDEPELVWESFLGLRCGVPYSALNTYRAHSSIFAGYNSRPALRKLELAD